MIKSEQVARLAARYPAGRAGLITAQAKNRAPEAADPNVRFGVSIGSRRPFNHQPLTRLEDRSPSANCASRDDRSLGLAHICAVLDPAPSLLPTSAAEDQHQLSRKGYVARLLCSGVRKRRSAVAGRVRFLGFDTMERAPAHLIVQSLPWYCEARLVAPSIAFYSGSLLECVRRWNRLPSSDRARAFIVVEDAAANLLKPTDLIEIVCAPEYLSL
jgi:hypothetical protein